MIQPVAEQEQGKKADEPGDDQPGVVEKRRDEGADRADQREDDEVAQARMRVFAGAHRPFKTDKKAQCSGQSEPEKKCEEFLPRHTHP